VAWEPRAALACCVYFAVGVERRPGRSDRAFILVAAVRGSGLRGPAACAHWHRSTPRTVQEMILVCESTSPFASTVSTTSWFPAT
jgi:hypothetical protein